MTDLFRRLILELAEQYLKENKITEDEINSINYTDIAEAIVADDRIKVPIKEVTKEYLDKLILLDGKPKYPIILDENNLPVLEIKYEWK